MIRLKTKEEIKILREGGKHLAEILLKIGEMAKPGISSLELDRYAFELIEKFGDKPAFLNYQPKGVSFPYPFSTCLSLNDEIVHGLPKEEKKLKDGDIVGIDIGLIHRGLYLDNAITVPIGRVDRIGLEMIAVSKEALNIGIKEAKVGNKTGDIGYAIENYVKEFGFGLVKDLAGHGVGYAVHEEPFVPNFGRPGSGVGLVEGLVIAIEPMINEGKSSIVLDKDGQTYRTKDGGRSAHFEHTVALTGEGPLVLTTL